MPKKTRARLDGYVHGSPPLLAPFPLLQVEVRPLAMSTSWANAYFFRQLQRERLIHW